MRNYFDKFGQKPSCFEDLKSYVISLSDDDLTSWTSYLQSITLSTVGTLRKIHIYKEMFMFCLGFRP
jgi:N-terminal acetyltransferase B complex non-catalytic subunit